VGWALLVGPVPAALLDTAVQEHHGCWCHHSRVAAHGAET
jgi:hypothetical protein